jgi:uncharacterized membrane protein (UPF0182 family)
MRGGCSSPASAAGISACNTRLVTVGLGVVALLFASASIDYWTIMRFFGSRGVMLSPDAWKDQAFSRALPVYLPDLPFYSEVLGFVFARRLFAPFESCSGIHLTIAVKYKKYYNISLDSTS